MTHFFANPLSITLNDDPTHVPLQEAHYEAVRNLPSFRRYIMHRLLGYDMVIEC